LKGGLVTALAVELYRSGRFSSAPQQRINSLKNTGYKPVSIAELQSGFELTENSIKLHANPPMAEIKRTDPLINGG
jgi:hypothetical protein